MKTQQHYSNTPRCLIIAFSCATWMAQCGQRPRRARRGHGGRQPRPHRHPASVQEFGRGGARPTPDRVVRTWPNRGRPMPATQPQERGREEGKNTIGITRKGLKKKKRNKTTSLNAVRNTSTNQPRGTTCRDAGVGGTSSQRVRRTRACALCNRACTARSENGECRHSATTSADDWMADW